MRSFEEFYKEAQNNEELKKEFISAFKEGKTEEFLKAHDCDAALSDVYKFLNGTKSEIASEDDLAMVAGGRCTSYTCNMTCGCDSYDYWCM